MNWSAGTPFGRLLMKSYYHFFQASETLPLIIEILATFSSLKLSRNTASEVVGAELFLLLSFDAASRHQRKGLLVKHQEANQVQGIQRCKGNFSGRGLG